VLVAKTISALPSLSTSATIGYSMRVRLSDGSLNKTVESRPL